MITKDGSIIGRSKSNGIVALEKETEGALNHAHISKNSAMLKHRLIVFVGTVGSGKSTQIKLLHLRLRQRRLRAKISFLKTGHLLAFILQVILAKMLTKRRYISPIRTLVEEKPYLFKKIFRLWIYLDLISVTITFLAKICLPLKLGYTVIVEEYIPAIISDYMYLSKLVKFPLKTNFFTIRYMLRLMSLCNPTQIIYLDAENDKLAFRWKVRRSFEEREDYIRMQRSILLQISKKLSYTFLYVNTGAKTIDETHNLIINSLLRNGNK